MNAEQFAEHLKRIRACKPARTWASGKSLAEAWATCPEPRWMMWYAGRVSAGPGSPSRNKLTLTLCEIARLVLCDGDDSLRIAIETAERYARGEEGVAIDDVRRAAYAASAAYAARAASAAYAARAASAAYAADAYATAAAYHVTDTVTIAAGGGDDITTIIRKWYPEPPTMEEGETS